MPNRQMEEDRTAINRTLLERAMEYALTHRHEKIDQDIDGVIAMHKRLTEVVEQFFGTDDENEIVVRSLLLQWIDTARQARVGMLRNEREEILAFDDDYDPKNYLPKPAHRIHREYIAEEEETENGMKKYIPHAVQTLITLVMVIVSHFWR